MVLLSQIKVICVGCGRLISPDEDSVKFNCPNCGDTTIWRCETCKKFVRPYKCIKCDFTGP
ncbi:MAG: zinc finger domain-containing protein [Candidatus Helarchaeota archaeon]